MFDTITISFAAKYLMIISIRGDLAMTHAQAIQMILFVSDV
jgi:hypothetical protein